MTHAAPSRGFNPESPKEAGQFTVRVVSFVIFLSGQLFNLNCCADLPTSATASSMNYIHYAPSCALPWLQSRTHLKEAGQLILQVVSCTNFYFLQLYNLICSSWRALFCHPPLICITNPMPRPPMAWIESLSEEPSDWPHQWWVFVSYFILSTI